MTPRTRRPAANFALLSAGEIGGRLLTFLAMVVLTRSLGVERFGVLAFASATVAYLELAVAFGLGHLGQLEIARDRIPHRDLIAAVVGIRLAIAVLALAALAGFLRWAPLPDEARELTLLFALILLPRALQLDWPLLGVERMAPVALSNVAAEAVLASGVVLLVRGPDDLLRVPLIYLASRAGLALLLGRATWRRFRAPRSLPDPKLALRLVRDAAPIAATMGCALLFYNFDLVLLGVVSGAEASGLYGASHRVFLLLLILTLAYAVSLRPALARGSERGYASIESLLESSLRVSFAAAVGVAAGGAVLAGPILELLFGPAFRAGAPILAFLCIGFALHVANRQYRDVLVAFRHQGSELRVVAAGAALNVALAVALVPRHGAVGAAAATLTAEILVLTLVLRAVRHHVAAAIPTPPWGRAAACGAALALFLELVAGPHVLVRIALGAMVYVALAFLARVARPRDIRRLLALSER